jgi:putative ATP-dependent endonuclease of the OLD family
LWSPNFWALPKKETAIDSVLGEGGEGIVPYNELHPGYDDLMPAYRYHFITRSKPATHLRAFTQLDDTVLKKEMPKTYRALLKHVMDNLKRERQ